MEKSIWMLKWVKINGHALENFLAICDQFLLYIPADHLIESLDLGLLNSQEIVQINKDMRKRRAKLMVEENDVKLSASLPNGGLSPQSMPQHHHHHHQQHNHLPLSPSRQHSCQREDSPQVKDFPTAANGNHDVDSINAANHGNGVPRKPKKSQLKTVNNNDISYHTLLMKRRNDDDGSHGREEEEEDDDEEDGAEEGDAREEAVEVTEKKRGKKRKQPSTSQGKKPRRKSNGEEKAGHGNQRDEDDDEVEREEDGGEVQGERAEEEGEGKFGKKKKKKKKKKMSHEGLNGSLGEGEKDLPDDVNEGPGNKEGDEERVGEEDPQTSKSALTTKKKKRKRLESSEEEEGGGRKFRWKTYIRENKLVAAPPEAFKQRWPPPKHQFEEGMYLEVIDTDLNKLSQSR